MFRKLTARFLIAWLVLSLFPLPVLLANSTVEKEARQTEKIKAGIFKLGVGREALVNIKLKNKAKISGYISEAGDSSFTVADLHSARSAVITYPEVVQVQGNNLSTKVKIIIGVSVVAGIIIVLYIVKGAFCDGC